jgi:hypothetical protein
LLVYVDYVNILGENINTTKKNAEASREVNLGVNTENIKYAVVSRHQNVGRNHNLLTATKSFENVAKFKYLGTATINRNASTNKLRAGEIWEMLATILLRGSCLHVPVFNYAPRHEDILGGGKKSYSSMHS